MTDKINSIKNVLNESNHSQASLAHDTHPDSLHGSFDEKHVLHELKHYLPSQTPLKDFIHHNSLHAFQHLKFYEAIFKASKIFGYQVTMQLTEFRELYGIGRIKDTILERVITEKKGAENLVK